MISRRLAKGVTRRARLEVMPTPHTLLGMIC